MSSSLVKSDGREAMPWIRDLSLVGGATGVGTPLAALIGIGVIHEPWTWAYLATAGIAGLVTGAMLGALTPALLSRWLGRWPRLAFIGAALAAGGLCGALVGAVAGAAGGASWNPRLIRDMAEISAFLAAPLGALQLGWFWVAAATRRARRRPVHRLVLGAALAAPLLAAAPFLIGRFF